MIAPWYNCILIFSKEFSKKLYLWLDYSTFWLLGLFVSALHEDYILHFCRFCECFFVFVLLPFLNQEADPCFGQILADSGRNLLIPPNRFGSLFSSVFLTQRSACFCWKLPQTHLPFMQILPFLCCVYFYVFMDYTQLSDVCHFCVIALSSALSSCVTLSPLSILYSSYPSLHPSRCPPDRDEWGVRPGEVWVCCHQQRWDTLFHSS